MPLFLTGCFPEDFQEVKRPLRAKSVKRPIKVAKRPINEGKRPIKAMVLVGISISCLMGCFRAPPPWWKTAPLKRPIKRSMSIRRLSDKLGFADGVRSLGWPCGSSQTLECTRLTWSGKGQCINTVHTYWVHSLSFLPLVWFFWGDFLGKFYLLTRRIL